MKQELWRRVEALFHAARERPPEARPAFLEEACGGDLVLRREVLRLLSKEAQAASFLESPSCEFRGEVEALLAGLADDDAIPETPPAAPAPSSRPAGASDRTRSSRCQRHESGRSHSLAITSDTVRR